MKATITSHLKILQQLLIPIPSGQVSSINSYFTLSQKISFDSQVRCGSDDYSQSNTPCATEYLSM